MPKLLLLADSLPSVTVTSTVFHTVLLTIIHPVEKPNVVRQPENRRVTSGEKNVKLSVTAKGRSMKFKWRKHGKHSDDIKLLEDGDLYHVTESVIISYYT